MAKKKKKVINPVVFDNPLDETVESIKRPTTAKDRTAIPTPDTDVPVIKPPVSAPVSNDFYRPPAATVSGAKRPITPLSPQASTPERVAKLKELGYYSPGQEVTNAAGTPYPHMPIDVAKTQAQPTDGAVQPGKETFQQYRERIAFERLPSGQQAEVLRKQKERAGFRAQRADIAKRTEAKTAEAQRKADLEERRVVTTEQAGERAAIKAQQEAELYPVETELKQIELEKARTESAYSRPLAEQNLIQEEYKSEQDKYVTATKKLELIEAEGRPQKEWEKERKAQAATQQTAWDRLDTNFELVKGVAQEIRLDRVNEHLEELLAKYPASEHPVVMQKVARKIDGAVRRLDGDIAYYKELVKDPKKDTLDPKRSKDELKAEKEALEAERNNLAGMAASLRNENQVIKPTQQALNRTLPRTGATTPAVPATTTPAAAPPPPPLRVTRAGIDLLPDGSFYTGADGKVYMKPVPGKTKEQVFAERGIR